MKPIKLPYIKQFAIPLVPGQTINGSHIMAEIQKRIDREMKVISSVLAIESLIDDALKMSLFREVKNDLDFVAGNILGSDWCTFAAKRKLLNTVLDKYQLITGNDRNELDNKLSKAMKYRNAFAHGSITYMDDRIWLSYFESKQVRLELNEEYWDRLSDDINFAFDELSELCSKLRKNRISQEDHPKEALNKC